MKSLIFIDLTPFFFSLRCPAGRIVSYGGDPASGLSFITVRQVWPSLVVSGYFVLGGDYFRIQPEFDPLHARFTDMTVFRESDWSDLPPTDAAAMACATSDPDADPLPSSARARRADLSVAQIARVGVFVDCNHMSGKSSSDVMADVLGAIAWANERFSSDLNVTLVVPSGSWVFDTSCGSTFRTACASGMSIADRLSGFSVWRGARYAAAAPVSTEALWIDITNCYQYEKGGKEKGIEGLRRV